MAQRSDEPEFGSDSFLDVVTNVVGILIILVVVVGLRIKQAPAVAATTQPVDLETPKAAVAQLDQDVLRLDHEVSQLETELASRQAERQQAALLVTLAERELAQRQAELDVHGREQVALRGQLATAERELGDLEAETRQLAGQSPRAVRVVTYPTPLARTVEGQELHFMLRDGQVVHLPIQELLELCKTEAQSRLWKLKESPTCTGTVGPVDGFRLRYVLERVEVTLEGGGRVAAFAQLAQWELVPSSQVLGETAKEALAANSDFRRRLAAWVPRKATVTLWTYPDSFALYRELKEALFHQGYATAGRPLPEDIAIGGSPDGSRSAAQ